MNKAQQIKIMEKWGFIISVEDSGLICVRSGRGCYIYNSVNEAYQNLIKIYTRKKVMTRQEKIDRFKRDGYEPSFDMNSGKFLLRVGSYLQRFNSINEAFESIYGKAKL